MKTAAAILVALIAGRALADPGHFAPERGHSHWLALVAVLLALVVGFAAVWRRRPPAAARRARRRA